MDPLDNYVALTNAGEQTCSTCGDVRECLRLWEIESDDHVQNSISCCALCFLDAEGRYKNEAAVEVLRDFEDIAPQGIRLYGEKVVVSTKSKFGEFNHVHYTEHSFAPQSKGKLPDGEEVQVLTSTSSLTGISEVFDADGQFITSPATYSDVARRALLKGGE